MAQREHLEWFRGRLAASKAKESSDATPILAWRENLQQQITFRSWLIPIGELRSWGPDEGGNIRHETGLFFSVEGVRVEAGGLREVRGWDQPILTQVEGGLLMLVAREHPAHGIQFLLQAKAEPGNIGSLQLVPSMQATWSNLKRAHQGKNPPLTEVTQAQHGVRWIYRAEHNEEGGRFWKKSNENILIFVEDESVITSDLTMFCWASLSQIRELALVDNVLSTFVKSIIAPL
jgi:dTDP-4-dehydro-6-deoxy-alpha-D-glucopyranose 2,3-dehydratase